MRRFELSEGTSNKFWQIELAGASVTVTWGRIGTAGQTQTKSFDTSTKAQSEHDKLVKEKIKKGYTETGGGGTSVASAVSTPKPKPAAAAAAPPKTGAPAPAPAPRKQEPAAPLAVTAGLAWTPEAKREVAPRRGWDVVAAKKPDAKTAFARIREGFKAAAPLLDKGLQGKDADAARMNAARKAFEGAPEETLDLEAQATAFALVGPRFSYGDRARCQDFIRYWAAVAGTEFAMRALARASQVPTSCSIGTHYELVELAAMTDRNVKVDAPWFRTHDDDTWRALRHAVLAEGDGARAVLEAVASELRAGAPLFVRTVLACALEREDWARADLDEGLRTATVHGGASAWSWPLVLVLPWNDANEYFDKMAPHAWALVQGFEANRFDLVASFGTAMAPRFTAAIKDGAEAGAEKVRAIGEALGIIVTAEVVTFFLEQLTSKDLRAIASSYLITHAEASVAAVAQTATGKGPLADAARTVLRALVASRADAVANVKASLSGAALALLESFQADSAPRDEAAPDELPRVLRELPWMRRITLPPPKIVKGLSPGPCEESMEWRPGEREEAAKETGWMAPVPEERATTLAAIKEANEAQTAGMSSWQLPPSRLFAQLSGSDAVKAFVEADFTKFGWAYHGVVEVLVARHGLAVLPGVIRFAETDLAAAVEALRRVRSPRVAPVMADAFARLKKSRALASEWLLANPEAAAIGLVPTAVGDGKSARAHAEIALRFLASRGHRAVIEEVAKGHGDEALAAVTVVLDFDPHLLLPTKIGTLPSFFNAAAFTRPLLAGRTKALPLESVEAIGTMLSFTSWDEPYAGLSDVKAACDPRSLADFAWDLFQAWLVAGAPSKQAWGFLALGLFGDDECARKLTPLVRAWPGEAAHARAVLGLDVLAKIGTDVALMHLHGIAQKVKFKGLQEKAREKIDQIAEARGLSAEELADRLVPDLGLDDDGTLWLDFGPRKFKVAFDETLKPVVVDEAGKPMPDLPKAKQSDDAEKAKAATETWRALKKDAKTIAQGQLLRLELAMCSQRRWSNEVFRTFLLEHPLLVHIVRRLVWGAWDKDGALVGTFRVAEDSSLASAEDEPFELAEDAEIGIAHRLEIGDALVGTWGQVFADYEVLQPFEQLARAVAAMTDADRTAKVLDVVKGLTVPTGKVLGLDARGWRRGPPQDAGVVCWYEKPVQGGITVTLDLDPGIYTGMISESPEQTLGSVSISKEGGGWYANDKGLPFGDLSAIVFSELVRDLESLRA